MWSVTWISPSLLQHRCHLLEIAIQNENWCVSSIIFLETSPILTLRGCVPILPSCVNDAPYGSIATSGIATRLLLKFRRTLQLELGAYVNCLLSLYLSHKYIPPRYFCGIKIPLREVFCQNQSLSIAPTEALLQCAAPRRRNLWEVKYDTLHDFFLNFFKLFCKLWEEIVQNCAALQSIQFSMWRCILWISMILLMLLSFHSG